tara:strand:+ start:386 stop:580 length:195 start_codon:yes stop_codon:yes gene_type:complete
MNKFKKDDRVLDDYLGAGSVLGSWPIKTGVVDIAYMVLFDKTPDVRYNIGENPCMVFTGSLKAE